MELYIEGRGFESESEIEESAVFCLLPSTVALLYPLPLPSPSLSVLSERLIIAVAAVEVEVGREVDDIDCLVRGPVSLGGARGTGRGGGRDRGRRAEEGGLRRGLVLGSVREKGVGDDEFTSSLSPPLSLSLSLSPCVLPAILSLTCCVIDCVDCVMLIILSHGFPSTKKSDAGGEKAIFVPVAFSRNCNLLRLDARDR